MAHLEEIIRIFQDDKQAEYDFSKAPNLIKRKIGLETKFIDRNRLSKWKKAQNSFIDWTKDNNIFNNSYIKDGKLSFDSFFKERGPLNGDILDIGGGWGLYRQWWEPADTDIFVVHDPGIERFLEGPHQLHREYYSKAFSQPMVFVEGFGEELPYRDETFSYSIIASTLDHCIDPDRVLAEAYRCTKHYGSILVIQSCLSSQSGHGVNILGRAIKHLKNPAYLVAALSRRLLTPSHHLHHFKPNDIVLLLTKAQYTDVHSKIIPTSQDITSQNVYAFEARKL